MLLMSSINYNYNNDIEMVKFWGDDSIALCMCAGLPLYSCYVFYVFFMLAVAQIARHGTHNNLNLNLTPWQRWQTVKVNISSYGRMEENPKYVLKAHWRSGKKGKLYTNLTPNLFSDNIIWHAYV